MRRALLLYNPQAGRASASRADTIQRIALALREHRLHVETEPTLAPGSAGEQARAAIVRGFDTIFACGGDGTLHDTLQGLVHTGATLGAIPLGSANALARNLGLPLDPVRAALIQLNWQPRLIPVGHLSSPTHQRHFLVVAGAGPDGALVYRTLAQGKQRYGRLSYYVRAAHLFATHPFHTIRVTCTLPDESTQTHLAISAMCSRIGNLGGAFRPLFLAAELTSPTLTLSLVHPPARRALLAWFALSWARLHRFNRLVTTLEVRQFTVTGSTHLEADGESLGHTPAIFSLIPDALCLLMPP